LEKIIITGGSGFIGTNLVQYYLDRDIKVLNYDIKSPRNKSHIKYWQRADILDIETLSKVIQEFNPDYIFHLAARTDLDGNCIEDYAANTQGVSNLVEAAKCASDLKRVIFASSMLVCELGYQPVNELDYFPSTPYGESKVEGEKIVRSEAGDTYSWLIVRPTSIWGPWFDVPYKSFFTAVMKGHYFHPKGLEVKRSYGFVLNAVSELIKLASCREELVHSKTFYLADYEPIELKSWGVMIQQALNSREIKEVPVAAFILAAKIGDLLKKMGYTSPPMTTFRFNNMRTNAVFDMNEVKALCGDLPYSVREGVEHTVAWMKQL
jgi:nucleoside-diphosphate-sugar epimerase